MLQNSGPAPRSFLIGLALSLLVYSWLMVGGTPVYASQKSEKTIDKPTSSEKKTDAATPWTPPAPAEDEFDWIQLTSGEWLKGELKALYDNKLEFDSDKLGLQKLKLKDVAFIRSAKVFSVNLEGANTVDGLLQINKDKVLVSVKGSPQEFDRKKLVSFAPGAPRERNYWSSKITLGLTFLSGNTDQINWSTIAGLQRRTSRTRFDLKYLGNFSQTKEVETSNSQRVTSYFDIFLTRRLFVRPLSFQYYRNPFSNIQHRLTLGAGLGYHLINTPSTKWDVFGGPAYQRTEFGQALAGGETVEYTPAFSGGTYFETEVTSKVDFIIDYDFQIVNEKSGTYNHHLITTLETELTKLLDFNVSLIWDRIQDPQPESSGKIPLQDDFKVIFGLGVKL